jgi:hypothetical protein
MAAGRISFLETGNMPMQRVLMRVRQRVRIVSDERAEPPKKRRFVEYRLAREAEGGDFAVYDIFDEFNPVTDEYERKREVTSIDVPAGLGQEFISACTAIRREIDRFGMKMFFDNIGSYGKTHPKWRYRLSGRLRTDFVRVADEDHEDPYDGDPDSVPVGIVEMVRADREYYRKKDWKIWFGRKLQRKREDVIRQEVLNKLRIQAS